MSYGGKSVNSHDMRRLYVHGCGSWVCVPAVQMKWWVLYVPAERINKEALHVFQPACVYNSTTPLP